VSGQTNVRPEERRGVALAFATLLGILAAYALLETARDALFLARLSPTELPWVYIVMAAVAVGLAELQGKGLGVSPSLRLSLTLGFGATVTLGFYLLRPAGDPWLLRAFYVWAGAIATLVGVQFWVLLGDVYTITQAKRLYRLIGTGSLTGAALGAGLARAASGVLPAEALIALGAAVMAVSAGLAFFLGRQVRGEGDAPTPARWRLRDFRSFLQREPYVTRLAGLVLVVSVAVTLADFVFKSEVARHVAAEDLARFFATFYGALSALALFVQVVLMGWILRALDVHRALWTLPLLMLGGAAGIVIGGGLVAALLLKGADGALRPSLNRTSTELLFLPIPDGLRSRVKPAIDVIGQRGGQAVASLFILSQLALGRGDTLMAVFVAVLCVAWVAAIAELRPHYVEMFRRALREGVIEARGGLPELDLVSLETLFASLNSRDDAEVIAALDLLHAEDRIHLVPALILYHPTPAVVLRALELFEAAGRVDFGPVADRLLEHADAEVRAAALRAQARADPDGGRLRGALADPSPLVRATALAGLLAEIPPGEDAWPLLEVILGERAPEARRALARAIQQKPVPAFIPVLDALSTDPQDDVQLAVARSIGALREESFLPTLLEQLRREAVRAEARRAFREFGTKGLEFLERALEDATLPQELRRHIPRAIASFPAADAVAVLQRHLVSEQDGMVRFKVHRALGRIATRHPEVALDGALVSTAAERTVEAICRLAHWRSILEEGGEAEPGRATPGHQMLVALLRDKAEKAEERLFRLLGLIHRGENFRRIYRGLRSPDRRLRASSRELLENVLRPPLKAAVLALVDGTSTLADREATAPYYDPPALDYEDVVTRLVEQPGETLRSLAVFHVGELGLSHLRDRIAELRSQETSLFVGQMFDRSLRALATAGEDGRAR
jgi:ATP/ADP translocase/HEAT repeat protein